MLLCRPCARLESNGSDFRDCNDCGRPDAVTRTPAISSGVVDRRIAVTLSAISCQIEAGCDLLSGSAVFSCWKPEFVLWCFFDAPLADLNPMLMHADNSRRKEPPVRAPRFAARHTTVDRLMCTLEHAPLIYASSPAEGGPSRRPRGRKFGGSQKGVWRVVTL